MTGNPRLIPNMCLSDRRYPKFVPEAITMIVLGPGVMVVETANESTGAMNSIIMRLATLPAQTKTPPAAFTSGALIHIPATTHSPTERTAVP